MKNLTFLFFFLYTLSNSFAQTNVYHKFPKDSAMWREFASSYPFPVCKGYQYIIDGDTSISGKDYHKIQISGVYYGVDPLGSCALNSILSSFNNYSGCFREDTLNKKVFFILAGSQTESLLYNFNLNLNDSLYKGLTNDSTLTHNYISSVDSILIGSEYRKRYGISSAWGASPENLFLIEGIGSTYGLIAKIEYQFEHGSELYCFTQNGIPLYQSSYFQSTCEAASINETEPLQTFNISINPNPFNLTAELKLNKTFKSFATEIYNLQGALISKNKYFNTDKVTIDRNSIESGFYFLKLMIDNKIVLTRKIVITD